MYVFFAETCDLFGHISNAHAHQEAVLSNKVFASFEFLIRDVELVDHAHVLEFMRFLVECLSADNEYVVLVPGYMHRSDVTAVGELLVCLQFNRDPSLLVNNVAFD